MLLLFNLKKIQIDINFKEEYPYSSTAATQLINISDVSSLDETNHPCLTFQKSGNHLNRSYLLVSIGLVFLIAIIFKITHVWLTYRAKRKTQMKSGYKMKHVTQIQNCICHWTLHHDVSEFNYVQINPGNLKINTYIKGQEFFVNNFLYF